MCLDDDIGWVEWFILERATQNLLRASRIAHLTRNILFTLGLYTYVSSLAIQILILFSAQLIQHCTTPTLSLGPIIPFACSIRRTTIGKYFTYYLFTYAHVVNVSLEYSTNIYSYQSRLEIQFAC